MKKLECLKKGDTIGIFSCSSPTSKEALNKMTSYFEDKGYKVKVAPNTLADFGFMAGSPMERADDLHLLIKDTEVSIIITANGGDSAIQMLPYVDFKLIEQNPKPICGLSDPTSLLNAISCTSGISTFHGPNGYNFGQTIPTTYTENNWWKIITGDFQLPYIFPTDKITVIKEDVDKTGILYGGNLGVFSDLLGTKWFPNLDGKILFFEEIFKELHQIDTMLTRLRISGALDKIEGLILGENVECNEQSYQHKESYYDLILRNFKDFSIPIIADIQLGHTENKITLPIGCNVSISTSEKRIMLLESPF